MRWELVDTGASSAEKNMQIDADLLEGLKERPILHFYEWEQPSATYGYFVDPSEYFDLEKAQKAGLALARRPTGGGIVFHLWDFAFSVLIPSTSHHFSLETLKNYAYVNGVVKLAVQEFLSDHQKLELTQGDGKTTHPSQERFCMARPTKYDLVVGNRKIAGAAQRKRRQGFLHQGTIALALPSTLFLDTVLLSQTEVKEAMVAHTFPLLADSATLSEHKKAKERLRSLLYKHFTQDER